MSVTLEEIQNEKQPRSLRFLQSLVFHLASEKEADEENPPQAFAIWRAFLSSVPLSKRISEACVARDK